METEAQPTTLESSSGESIGQETVYVLPESKQPDSWGQILKDVCEILSKGGPFFNGR